MNTELSSKYDPSAVEATAYQVWLDEKCFHADPAKPGEPYTIVIPPPNVTGALHLGHAMNSTLQDILTRAHRMMGFNTLWIPGIDHAGIATQAVVEKQLKEQENKTRHDVGREGLVERIWQWKQQYGDRILSQLKRLGCSCDWDRTRFTLDEMCAKAVRETFFKLFEDGLIYRGKRLVNWDTFLQTSISDDEIYHETVKTNLWHIRYPIEETTARDTGVPPVPVAAGVGESQSPESAHTQHGRDARVTSDATRGSSRITGVSPVSASQESPAQGAPAPSPLYSGERAGVRGDSGDSAVSESPSTNRPSSQPSPLSTGEKEPETSRPSHMVVATTRPETLLADTAVAVHSQDPRWNWAIGKHVRLPLTGRLIPIIADDILVDPKFGTGVVKVTPAHDPNDYAGWSRHKGQADEIEIINLLTPDGKINADRPEWSKYAGLKRAAARTAVVEDLKATGLLEKEEPYETQVGHSDRSKTAVEPYLSDQWFVKMAPLAEPALQVVREGKIKFYPERHAQQYLSWLGEKRDWPVSRQLWWGHRIPVWSKEVGVSREFLTAATAHRGKVLMQAKEGDLIGENGTAWGFARGLVNLETGKVYHAICVNASHPEIEKRLEEDGYVQDPDVLDTWFSSALWPHSTLGWPEQTPELARYYPTSVLLTGRDIITLWVARMVMMGMYNMGKGDGATGRRGDGETWGQRTAGENSNRDTGVPPVRGAQGFEQPHNPTSTSHQHGRDARVTMTQSAPAPSPLYAGEGAGVRGDSGGSAGSESPSTNRPSSQPSPLSTGEKEPADHRGTGGPPVSSASAQEDHGRAARATAARTLGIPFLDVAINPTILDGKGERMSKSKGNGVDPVDIIDSYGADALRFTLTKMATETQDARMPVKRDANGKNTSEKFDEGRNFCNKLWNACRFALSNLEFVGSAFADAGSSLAPTASAKADPTLVDKWIVSRFHRAVDESNQALKAYRFDVYAKTCYDFFWRDFCDWYVEAIKPAMKDPARAPQTANVLAAVLDGSLRLMHPMIPFITETVWWRLNDVRPERGLPGLLECPQSKRLVLAAWPSAVARDFGELSRVAALPWFGAEKSQAGEEKDTGGPPVPRGDDAEIAFAKLQEIITAIRTIRNDYQVNPKQAVKASIKAPADFAGQIEANRELVELLATCTLAAVGSSIAPVANAVTANAAGAEIFVEGLIDPNAEEARLAKDRDAKQKQVASMKSRLGNEAYIAKAPAKVVQETKDQLAAAEAELARIEEAIKKLE